MEMDSFSEGEYDSDASGMDDNAEDDVPNEQDNELNNEETEDDGKGESKSNSKSTLMSNISKLSKYKSNMHRKDVRKIKSKEKRDRRERAKELGLPKQTPRTIESTRLPNEDLVEPGDTEVEIDESLDEMSSYFKKEIVPKILITADDNPHTKTIKFCRELRNAIPNSEFRFRKKSSIKKMVKCAIERDYSDILIINEDWRKPNALLHIHLPNGPTAYYKLSSIRYCKEIKNRAQFNNCRPEVIINNMTTRLGHSVGRMLASVFHYEPQFKGRKVVTFHNQRDYIFFRQHLYEFKNDSKVAIRELGPRFTLKLRSLQRGTFNSKYGEYEWILKRHEQAGGENRRKFFL